MLLVSLRDAVEMGLTLWKATKRSPIRYEITRSRSAVRFQRGASEEATEHHPSSNAGAQADAHGVEAETQPAPPQCELGLRYAGDARAPGQRTTSIF